MKRLLLLLSWLLLSLSARAQYSGTGTVSLTAPAGAASVQWYDLTSGSPVAISGQTSTTYAASQPGVYYATFQLGGTGDCTDYDIVITQGSSVTLNGTTNNTGGTSYQWYQENVVVSGATSANYAATTGGTYRFEFDNGGTCSIKSDDYKVYTLATCANPSIGGTATYAGGPLCNSTNAGTVTLSGNTGSVVKWQSSTDGGITWTDIAGTADKTIYSFINAGNGQQFRAVVNSGVGCVDAVSAPATIATSAGACAASSCDNTAGAIALTVVSSLTASTYSHQVIATNAAGVIQYVSAPGSTTITGVAAGTYYVYRVTFDNTISPLPTLTVGTSLTGIGGGCVAYSSQIVYQVCTLVPPTVAITTPKNITITSTNPPISGTATASASVTVVGPNSQTCITTADASGNWTCTSLTFTVGTQTVTAVASNSAGVSTVATTSFTVVCTTPATPTAVTATQPTCSVATGTFTISNYSAANTYTFSPSAGVSQSGATVTAPAGTYTIQATANGCTSVASAPVTINTAPACLPTIAITTPKNVTITSTNPPISGTATASASVTVNAPNGQTCFTTADVTGAWSCTSLVFTVGSQTVTAVASNSAGVSTVATTSFTVVAPAAVCSVSLASGGICSTLTPVTTGGVAPLTYTWTGPTVTVTAVNKDVTHPYFGLGSTMGFAINGVQGKQLTLIRGVTYTFSVNTPGHPFEFTNSPVGGAANTGQVITAGVTNAGATSGNITFTPSAATPNLIYYNCNVHDYMGYQINIIDPQANGVLVNAMPGSYALMVMDATGCMSTTTATVSASCAPVCSATLAPVLSATSKTNVCPATTIDLSTITASNTPAGTTLTWHSASPATAVNRLSSVTSLTAGTYYAAFYDATNNCYSGAAVTPVTASTVVCCPNPSIGGSLTLVGTLPLCSVSNQGLLMLSGQTGTVVKWQTSTNGGTTFTDIAGTAGLMQYSFTNVQNNQQFRAVVNAGGSCADANSTPFVTPTSASACSVDCLVLPGGIVK